MPQESLQNHVLKIKWSDGEIRVTDGHWILHYDGALDEHLGIVGKRSIYRLRKNYRLDIPTTLEVGALPRSTIERTGPVIIDLRVDSAPLIVQRARQKRRSKRSTKTRRRKTRKRKSKRTRR